MQDTKTNQADKQKQLMIDYKATFGTEAGQRVLYDMMRAHHITSSTHVTKDPDATAFNEGARNVVLRIMTYLNFDLERFNQRIKEGAQDHGIYGDIN